jgi:nucleotide-binding universal stress UspA family protein
MEPLMYQRILVPVDGSPTSKRGLGEAIALAKLTGANLRLINVVDVMVFAMEADAFAGYAGDMIGLLREGGQKVLEAARMQAEAAGVAADTVLRDGFSGRVCDLVVDEAKAWNAELIVIGTHGRRGAGRLLLGSDAEQILRLAPVPVLLVRAPEAAAA